MGSRDTRNEMERNRIDQSISPLLKVKYCVSVYIKGHIV